MTGQRVEKRYHDADASTDALAVYLGRASTYKEFRELGVQVVRGEEGITTTGTSPWHDAALNVVYTDDQRWVILHRFIPHNGGAGLVRERLLYPHYRANDLAKAILRQLALH